jgi:HEAT repeat protein
MSLEAKKLLAAALRSDDWPHSLEPLLGDVSRGTVGQAVGALCDPDPRVRWRAVEAVGALVCKLGKRDPEAAKDALRRLMWSINEESGSIGWGAPEAMAEVMARDRSLAQDFLPLYLSNVTGGSLGRMLPRIREGFLWGILRLWDAHAEELRRHRLGAEILPMLSSESGATRALAAALLGRLGVEESASRLAELARDRTEFDVLEQGEVVSKSVAEAAREALSLLKGRS